MSSEQMGWIKNRRAWLLALSCILLFLWVLWPEITLGTQVGADSANVRQQPSTNAQVVGTLGPNTEVTVLEWSGEWARIQAGSIQGWMHRSVLANVDMQLYVEVAESAVNLRGGPGTTYDVVGGAARGDRLVLLDNTSDWYQIKTSNGTVAYILGSLTTGEAIPGLAVSPQPAAAATTPSATAPPAQSAEQYVEITGNTVNLRSGPGVTYSTVGSVRKGIRIVYVGTEDGWYAVRNAKGETVYVSADYARLMDASGSAAPASSGGTGSSGSSAPTVYLNGNRLTFPDVEPMIVNSRTLVPMRAIFEAMGAEVSWIPSTRTVVGVGKDQTMIVLPVGSTTATVNDKTITLDVPAQIVRDRTMVPLRFVGESLGATVAWEAATRRIDITQSLEMTAPEPVTPVTPPAEPTEPEPVTPVEPVTPAEPEPEQPVAPVTTEPAEPVITEPTQPATPVITEPTAPVITSPFANRSLMTVTTSANDLGISVIISSDVKLNPDASQKGEVLTLNFEGTYVKENVDLTEAVGGGDLKVTAENTQNGTRVTVELPAGVESTFGASENGHEISLTILNRIRSVGRKVYGDSDEMVTVATVIPVKYQYLVEGRTMKIILTNTTIGIAKEKYSYYGSVMDTMTVKEVAGEEGPEVHLELTANQDCKFNTQLTDNGVLNIAVTAAAHETFVASGDNLVMIDPGHGGSEAGATYGGVDERHVNLQIALKVGAYLKSRGVNIAYTRTADTYVGLSERANMANRAKAALFVSVHCNASASNYSANGSETYFYAPMGRPELFSQRMERQELAACIQRNLVAKNGYYNRGVKEQNLAVLRESQMPSALVECGFLSNNTERASLLDDAMQQRIAEGIGNGIIEYMNKNLSNLTITPNQ